MPLNGTSGSPSEGPPASQEARKNGRVIEAVLFDLDGTLFDHRGAAEQAARRLADRFDSVVPHEDFLAAWFSSEELRMAEYLEVNARSPNKDAAVCKT